METVILITSIVRFTLVSGVLLVNGLCLIRLVCMLIKRSHTNSSSSTRDDIYNWTRSVSLRERHARPAPPAPPPTAVPPGTPSLPNSPIPIQTIYSPTPIEQALRGLSIAEADIYRKRSISRPRAKRRITGPPLKVCVHTVTTGFMLVASIVYLASWLPYLVSTLFGSHISPMMSLSPQDHCILQHSVSSQVTTVLLAILVVRKFYFAFSPSRARILSFAACIAWIVPQLTYLSAVDFLNHNQANQLASNSHLDSSLPNEEIKYYNRIIPFGSGQDESSSAAAHKAISGYEAPLAVPSGANPSRLVRFNVTPHHLLYPSLPAPSALALGANSEQLESEFGLMLCVHVLSQTVVSHLAWHYLVLVFPLTALVLMCYAVRFLKTSFNNMDDIKSCNCGDDLITTLALYFNLMWLLILRPLIVLQSLLLAIKPANPDAVFSSRPHHPLWDAIYWDEPPTYLDFGTHLVLMFTCVFVPFSSQGGFRAAFPPGIKYCARSFFGNSRSVDVQRNRSVKRIQSSRSRSSRRRRKSPTEEEQASDPKRFYFSSMNTNDTNNNSLTETSDISLPAGQQRPASTTGGQQRPSMKKMAAYERRSKSFRNAPTTSNTSPSGTSIMYSTPVQIGYISTEWARYRTPEVDYESEGEDVSGGYDTKDSRPSGSSSVQQVGTIMSTEQSYSSASAESHSRTSYHAGHVVSKTAAALISPDAAERELAFNRARSYRVRGIESQRDETVETFNNETIESLPVQLGQSFNAGQLASAQLCPRDGRKSRFLELTSVTNCLRTHGQQPSSGDESGPGRPVHINPYLSESNHTHKVVMATVLDDSELSNGKGADTAMQCSADRKYVQTL